MNLEYLIISRIFDVRIFNEFRIDYEYEYEFRIK